MWNNTLNIDEYVSIIVKDYKLSIHTHRHLKTKGLMSQALHVLYKALILSQVRDHL